MAKSSALITKGLLLLSLLLLVVEVPKKFAAALRSGKMAHWAISKMGFDTSSGRSIEKSENTKRAHLNQLEVQC